MTHRRLVGLWLTVVLAASLLCAATAGANPILMPTLSNEIGKQQAILAAHRLRRLLRADCRLGGATRWDQVGRGQHAVLPEGRRRAS